MKDAADYLAFIKALIVTNPQVAHWTSVREETQGERGLLRFRLTWRDGSLLEMFELFHVTEGNVRITKYSFHWQDASGQLLKRWDNAGHHPELPTHPHHIHHVTEANVQPHEPITAEAVLDLIAAETAEGQ